MSNEQNKQDAYLGDGVYASFDGFQIWLAANHHENKVVALDPNVVVMLMRYVERVYDLKISVTKVGEQA